MGQQTDMVTVFLDRHIIPFLNNSLYRFLQSKKINGILCGFLKTPCTYFSYIIFRDGKISLFQKLNIYMLPYIH